MVRKPSWRETAVVAAALAFLFSVWKIGAYALDGYENKKTYGEIRSVYYGPSAGEAPFSPLLPDAPVLHSVPAEKRLVNPKFEPLLERNGDVVGWVRIEGTRIDYPVVQAEDNAYYLHRDVDGERNAAGSIFMDYRNDAGGKDRHLIVYGHDMKNKTMFASLLEYESRWNFENKAVIEFDTLYADGRWAIFSAYTTSSSFDYIRTEFASDEDYEQFLATIQAKSLHASDIEVSAEDTILTLSTCSSAFEDARFVVHAKHLPPEEGNTFEPPVEAIQGEGRK